jgi:hypothetical protein
MSVFLLLLRTYRMEMNRLVLIFGIGKERKEFVGYFGLGEMDETKRKGV